MDYLGNSYSDDEETIKTCVANLCFNDTGSTCRINACFTNEEICATHFCFIDKKD